jgi:hypothetical protein
VRVWAGFLCLRIRKQGNKHSGSIKGGEFLDQLSEYQLLKKNYDPWSW